MADHVADISDGEDERDKPKAVEDIRDRRQGHAAVRAPAVVVVAEAREHDDDDVEEEEVCDDLHAAALAFFGVLLLVHLAEDHRVRAAPHGHAARADVAAAGAEAGRKFPLLVGLRLGDGRDEGLRAFYGLGGRGLLRRRGTSRSSGAWWRERA